MGLSWDPVLKVTVRSGSKPPAPLPSTPPVEQPLMGQTNAPVNGRLSGQTGDQRQGTEHPGLPYFIWPPELLRLLTY